MGRWSHRAVLRSGHRLRRGIPGTWRRPHEVMSPTRLYFSRMFRRRFCLLQIAPKRGSRRSHGSRCFVHVSPWLGVVWRTALWRSQARDSPDNGEIGDLACVTDAHAPASDGARVWVGSLDAPAAACPDVRGAYSITVVQALGCSALGARALPSAFARRPVASISVDGLGRRRSRHQRRRSASERIRQTPAPPCSSHARHPVEGSWRCFRLSRGSD
jgi:hypothetical protein